MHTLARPVDGVDGVFDADGGRQLFVGEGLAHLEQTRCSRSGDEVADVGLQRPKGDGRRPHRRRRRRRQQLLQALDFCFVSGLRSRGVTLKERCRRGVDSSVCPGCPQGTHLPLRGWRQQIFAAAVVAEAAAGDEGMNGAVGGEGVVEAHERDDGAAFGGHEAVGVFVEGLVTR